MELLFVRLHTTVTSPPLEGNSLLRHLEGTETRISSGWPFIELNFQ